MVLSLVQFEDLARKGLKSHASATDEDRTVALLRSFPKDADIENKSDWAAVAADVLTTTSSNRIRNAAALALADLGAVECSGRIVEVLRRPDLAKVSGTLLYALSELGASIPLHVFVGLIEHGSFEGRSEALAFLDEDRVELPDDAEVDGALQSLGRLASNSDDPEGAEAAQLALTYLRDPQTSLQDRSN